MDSERGRRIYEDLGVNPVINAMGSQTVLGGSRLSPGVLRAMQDANRYFVDMKELLKRSGEVIAGLLGAEAALVTPGCASVLSLGSAACMTGNDPEKMERLPATAGMRDEFLIQSRQRYKYERCVTVHGGKLVEVGDESGTTAGQLREAMTGANGRPALRRARRRGGRRSAGRRDGDCEGPWRSDNRRCGIPGVSAGRDVQIPPDGRRRCGVRREIFRVVQLHRDHVRTEGPG